MKSRCSCLKYTDNISIKFEFGTLEKNVETVLLNFSYPIRLLCHMVATITKRASQSCRDYEITSFKMEAQENLKARRLILFTSYT